MCFVLEQCLTVNPPEGLAQTSSASSRYAVTSHGETAACWLSHQACLSLQLDAEGDMLDALAAR